MTAGDRRLYQFWEHTKLVCHNENATAWRHYGGRGIRVCDEWRDDYPAFAARALAHGYGERMTLERVDPDGDFSPDNCKWRPLPDGAKWAIPAKRRPVVRDAATRYASVADAGRALVAEGAASTPVGAAGRVSHACRTGGTAYGSHWRYADGGSPDEAELERRRVEQAVERRERVERRRREMEADREGARRRAERARLVQERGDRRRRLRIQTERLDEAGRERAALAADLERERARLADLEAQAAEVRGRVADLTRRLSRAERDLRDLPDRISHTEERVAQLDRLLGE